MKNLYFLKTLFLSIFPLLFYSQKNYYVSNNGTDAISNNTGLSTSKPFKTIAYAVSKANYGDTVLVMAGTYTNPNYGNGDYWKSEQTIRISNRNPSLAEIGKYLTIKPYNNGLVVIKGDGDFAVQIRNSSYIRFEGFKIQGEVENIPLELAEQFQFKYKDKNGAIQERVPYGTPPSVVATMSFPSLNYAMRPAYFNTIGLIIQNSHHIDVINNEIHHFPGTGLRAFQSDYFNFIGNNIHNNSRRSAVGNHGLVVHSSTSIDEVNDYKIFISRNLVHDNYNELYSWNEQKTFITPHIDEGKGISMQKNSIENGWKNGKIKIDNNITYGNGFSGVHINQGIRMDIIHNTCYQNNFSSRSPYSNTGISVQEGTDVGVYNNISVSDAHLGHAYSAANYQNVIFDNNLAFGTIKSTNLSDGIITNTINAHPEFVNIENQDFQLTKNSPAINKALLAYTTENDYFDRIRDSIPDLGAVEYYDTLSAHTPAYRKQIQVYPNPSSDYIILKGKFSGKPEIISLEGKNLTHLTKNTRLHPEQLKIDLSKLNKGIYLIVVPEKSFKVIKH